MLTSLGIIFAFGLFFGYLSKLLKLPSLVGMMLAGVLVGPSFLNLINNDTLTVASELRQLALVIILTRAGLTLNIKDLKKVGFSAVLMCFLPALFEILATTFIAHKVFNLSYLNSALMGTVLGAVSPAVIVPRMIKVINEGYGKKNSVPQLILAGASADDIFVIVLFYSLLSLSLNNSFSPLNIIQIPTSILLGTFVGIVLGVVLNKFYSKFKLDLTIKIIILLSISFLLLELENILKPICSFSALISIMSVGITIFQLNINLSNELSKGYNNLWKVWEIVLFVLVGTQINLSYAFNFGLKSLCVLLFALLIRFVGVLIAVLPSKLNFKEKIFCLIAYTPKATVQAAIGSIPLSMGLSCGNQILTVAALSIILTAPIGAFLIDKTYKTLLK